MRRSVEAPRGRARASWRSTSVVTVRAFDRHGKVLDDIGDQVLYVGEIGAGNTAKLVHNCASITIRAAIAEVFTMGVKAGVEPAELWHAMRQGAIGRARTFDRIGDRYLQAAFDPPSFALALANKDLRLALELADELDVPMKCARLVQEDFQEALGRGWGNRDSTGADGPAERAGRRRDQAVGRRSAERPRPHVTNFEARCLRQH